MAALLFAVLKAALLLGFILFTVLVLIWLERKTLGRIQQRMGPMRVGPHGTLQSVADATKLLFKEDVAPRTADRLTFELAPLLVFLPAFLAFLVLPFAQNLVVVDLDMGLFYFVAVSSLATVGMVMAGWSSSNKYALIGAARTAAQLISYELPLVLVVLTVGMWAGTLHLGEIVEAQSGAGWFVLVQPLGFVLFLMAALSEVFRPPFDIPVAESEVLGGPMIEYSGMRWGLFFLAEYANAFALAMLGALVFLGGWKGPLLPPWVWLLAKTYLLVLFFFWMRAATPRLRIDQLMGLAWKVLIPFAFLNLFLTGLVKLYDGPAPLLGVLSLGALLLLGWVIERGLPTWRPSPSAAY